MTFRFSPQPMTPAELREWLGRHGHNTNTGGSALGVTKRQLLRLLSGKQPMTATQVLLCTAIDRLMYRKH